MTERAVRPEPSDRGRLIPQQPGTINYARAAKDDLAAGYHDDFCDLMNAIAAGTILLVAARFVFAEPITLETVEPPAEIAPDEPFAREFSLELAARSLDTAALDWQKTHACTACHTMFPYLMARPTLNVFMPQSVEVRKFFEEFVASKREAMPAYACKDVDGAVAIASIVGYAHRPQWLRWRNVVLKLTIRTCPWHVSFRLKPARQHVSNSGETTKPTVCQMAWSLELVYSGNEPPA